MSMIGEESLGNDKKMLKYWVEIHASKYSIIF
jgi:hypothetical protein